MNGRNNYRDVAVWAIGAALSLAGPAAGARAVDGEIVDTVDAPWQQAIAKDIRQAGQSDRARYQFHMLAGEMALARNQRVLAAEQYAQALAIKADPALAERAARIAVAADRPALAYPAVRIWALAEPSNIEAQRAAVELALANDDMAGVVDFAPRLAAAAETRPVGYEIVGELLSRRADDDQALAVARQIAEARPDDPGAAFLLALAAYNAGQSSQAEPAIERAVTQWPDWDRANLLAAAIDVRQQRFADARQRVASLGGDATAKAEYHLALARYLMQADQQAIAAKEFQAALAAQPDNLAARFGLGLVHLSAGDLDAARQSFQAVVDDPERGDEAAFYLGVIAEQQGRTADAREWYAQVDGGGRAFQANLRQALLTYRAGDLSAALSQLETLAQSQPDRRADVAAVRGDLLREAGRLEESLAVYDQALDKTPQAADLLYGRSLTYEMLGRIDDAEADLQQILSQDSTDARALNALGYMLTNHTEDYARAERYIRRALSRNPDNPAVIDSLGWVQFKRGRLPQARENLERAYAESSDPEVAVHLGRVRWAQGDREAARAIWREAAEAHPDNEQLQQTMNKFGL